MLAKGPVSSQCSPLAPPSFLQTPSFPIKPKISAPSPRFEFLTCVVDTSTSPLVPRSVTICSTSNTTANQTLATKSPSSKILQPKSAIDKAAERRRKNRESSSRCYYNRKRIIQNLETQLLAEKDKLTKLYDRALELRHDNARLKKEVVTNGYALPASSTKHAYQRSSSTFSIRDYLRLLHDSTYQNPSQTLL
ncbi:unnamed protein product [Agarophyton chilense]